MQMCMFDMEKRDDYNIDLLDSNLAGKTFEFQVNDAVFEAIDGLIDRGNVKSVVKCTSASQGLFRFCIHSEGVVTTPCNRCLADLELRIDTTNELMAKLGDDDSDDGNIITVNHESGFLNVLQPIYEFIALSMPISLVHEPGMCDKAMMEELSKHQATRSSGEDAKDDEMPNDETADSDVVSDDTDRSERNPVDPRWEVLKKLVDNNKN